MATTDSVDHQLDLLVDAVQELAVARRRGDAAGILPRLGDLLRDTLEVIGAPESRRGSSAGADPRSASADNGRMLSLVRSLRTSPAQADRFVVKSGGHLVFLPVDQVDWIEAAGNYVRLHAGPACHLLRETMTAIERRLDPAKFLRIHRCRIVNVDRVERLQPWLNGEYAVVLRTGTRLTLSRGCRVKLEERLRGAVLMSRPLDM